MLSYTSLLVTKPLFFLSTKSIKDPSVTKMLINLKHQVDNYKPIQNNNLKYVYIKN